MLKTTRVDISSYPTVVSVTSFARHLGVLYEVVETTQWFAPDRCCKSRTTNFVGFLDRGPPGLPSDEKTP